MTKIPGQENLTSESNGKSIFHYYDNTGKAVHKTKEISKVEGLFTFYPFTVNRASGQVAPKKIKAIEFRGWKDINDLPKDFRKLPGYGFNSSVVKSLLNFLYRKFPKLEKLIIVVNGRTRFSTKTISFDWADFESMIKALKKERGITEKNRRYLVNNLLAEQTDKFSKIDRTLTAGELDGFLRKFDSYDKISPRDIDALTEIFADIPPSKILATSHYIKAKEKIDTVYLEDIIKEFERLMRTKAEDEEAWQKFFEKNTWTLNHLFPYEVILSKGKAYVGGKTIENSEGRIVDFLFQNELKDNFALLEIKTPKAMLLKNTPYRGSSAYPVSDELSGGVNQCLDQKDVFLRELGQKYKSFDPWLVLVIGRKGDLKTEQASCFELYRANQKNVDIVTFDELYSKLQGFYNVITGGAAKS